MLSSCYSIVAVVDFSFAVVAIVYLFTLIDFLILLSDIAYQFFEDLVYNKECFKDNSCFP